MSNRVITALKLHLINNRITEITEILELCDPQFDRDVINNLRIELEYLVRRIEHSMYLSKRNNLRKVG